MRDTAGYSLYMHPWDELKVAIGDLFAAFKGAQTSVLPIGPSMALPDRVP